ncbi:hypothetical protein BD324DRAFT_637479 [Kockovaella imperatae]|uniref:Glutamine amidotransferase type-2 domain-containing protein n=1 Tax=Kockovaella imperatae TaxID=4999 RepID=A0A1Y1U8G7_9TREE|nr:hypothetical protein BD324DRAFT_637479 [Kockovaella imperatae]ORX34308.1 hypothetical protein BD324DRAFT_637479 [Kockovaella imperatae]
MCGIIASYTCGQDPSSVDIEAQLQASLKKIAHRGPDASGIWISNNGRCGLGHCRLSINDLSPAGSQPLHSPDGFIHAVVNGEIYDDGSLRDSLSYPFKSQSDSELVLALYQRHGIGFLSHLRGEFAFCLYDSRRDLFMAGRDRYGIKPLFWRREQDRIWFAAEMKAFLGAGWRPQWDVDSVQDGGWGQDTRTIFQGLHKLRPGHYMICRGGEPEIRPYWDLDYPTEQSPVENEDALIQSLRAHLIQSIRLRLRADVPVGIYLSGGIDSSAIAGIAAHLVKTEKISMGSVSEQVRCFSIGFDDTDFDESEIAERTAAFLGVSYHRAHMSEATLADHFEEATYHIEHHNHDLNYIGKYALSAVPGKHGYKVVLTGEGADEHFAGYPLFLPDFMRGQPEEVDLRQSIKDSYAGIGGSVDAFDDPDLKTLGLTTPACMAAFIPWAGLFTQAPKSSPVSVIVENVDPVTRSRMTRWHPIHSAMYIWTKGHLANQFLSCLGDRVEMAHSLEARTPFLDHHLTEFVNHLPPSLKIKKDKDGYIEKYALREAVKPFVTEEVYRRRKHAYTAPTKYAVGGPIYRKLEELLVRESVEHLGFIRWSVVEDLKRKTWELESVWAFRQLLIVAQWVVISKRFGVETHA